MFLMMYLVPGCLCVAVAPFLCGISLPPSPQFAHLPTQQSGEKKSCRMEADGLSDLHPDQSNMFFLADFLFLAYFFLYLSLGRSHGSYIRGCGRIGVRREGTCLFSVLPYRGVPFIGGFGGLWWCLGRLRLLLLGSCSCIVLVARRKELGGMCFNTRAEYGLCLCIDRAVVMTEYSNGSHATGKPNVVIRESLTVLNLLLPPLRAKPLSKWSSSLAR